MYTLCVTLLTLSTKTAIKDKNKEQHVAGYLALSPGSSTYKLYTVYTVHILECIQEEPGNEAA